MRITRAMAAIAAGMSAVFIVLAKQAESQVRTEALLADAGTRAGIGHFALPGRIHAHGNRFVGGITVASAIGKSGTTPGVRPRTGRPIIIPSGPAVETGRASECSRAGRQS